MTTLYLTADEQKQFDTISDSLKDGWTVETETGSYNDTPEQMVIRLSIIRLHDPKLLALKDSVEKTSTPADAAAIIFEHDLEDVNEDDMAELFFAMGPSVLTTLIQKQLSLIKTDQDVERLTALTVIRHSLFSALTPRS